MTCVKSGAKGCEMISIPNGEAVKEGCDVEDGLMKEKCKMTLSCSSGSPFVHPSFSSMILSGFAPSGSAALNDGKQTLECKAGNDGWIDQQGNKNVKPLECLPVCPLVRNDLILISTILLS